MMLNKVYCPQDIEESIYQLQEQSGIFSAGAMDGPAFAMMLPPPNVTGSLHMGHALNTSLQDILARYQRMCGRDVLWQPGTDHAGIATQMVVERNLASQGLDRVTLGREAFVKKIWQWREQSGDTILSQLRRLGASADWPRRRFTLDDGLCRSVSTVFVRLYRDGLIYRDRKLVNWDPVLGTAISDLEVVNRDIKTGMWHVRYPLLSSVGKVTFLSIATTRPETMAGDVAIAVHPDDDRYRSLIGKKCRLPIFDRVLPIIADRYADPEKGSGAVKITPAHDFNDFDVGRRHDLDMIDIFDGHGRYNENVARPWRGLDRVRARARVLAELERLGLLEREEKVTIPAPHGDRSMALIEPRLTRQWFVDAPKLAARAIEVVEKEQIRFIPRSWEKTYFEWMRNIEPWCISRQIWWGHRIPVWYGPDDHPFVALDSDAAHDASREHYGRDVDLRQDEDVLDTWFSSALWPFSTLGWPDDSPCLKRYYPGEVLVTGFDIIFFWIARMIMLGLYVMDDVPFRVVHVHALVRDSQGQKMSKSRGNVVNPLKLVERYGADALRFTLAALAVPGRDVRLDEERLRGYRNFATKIWNAARFCQMREITPVADFDPGACCKPLNIWLMRELADAGASIGKSLADGRFDEATGSVYRVIRSVFCDWYLELAKLRLSGDNSCVETRRSCAFAFDVALRLLAPFMPFISAELRRSLGFGDVATMARWPDVTLPPNVAKKGDDVAILIRYIGALRTARSDAGIPAGHPLPLVAGLDRSHARIVDDWRDEIARLARLEKITIAAPLGGHGRDARKNTKEERDRNAIRMHVPGGVFLLSVGDVVDLDRARDRLQKQIDEKKIEMDRCQAKIGNRQFMDKAPSHIIENHRRRLQRAKDDVAGLDDALRRLGDR